MQIFLGKQPPCILTTSRTVCHAHGNGEPLLPMTMIRNNTIAASPRVSTMMEDTTSLNMNDAETIMKADNAARQSIRDTGNRVSNL